MSELRRLSTLLSHPPVPATAVAIDQSGIITWEVFSELVAAWQEQIDRHDGQVFGVFLNDSLTFAAVLQALWQSNKTALLTGDCLPATLASLQGHVDGLIGDYPATDGLLHIPALTAPSHSLRPRFHALDINQLAVIVLTSGSTGEPKRVPVLLRQLEDELLMHSALWGGDSDAPVLGTVSHQHIYGLIWRVLWPLMNRRPFVRQHCQYMEDVVAWSRCFTGLSLVTTPSHLGRLPESIEWPGEHGRWAHVISSTAPLEKSDSVNASACFGVPVTEIFGSSETGGIAWRQQTVDDIWEALPGITVGSDDDSGALLLSSPLVAESGWLTTSDRVEILSETRFRLLGRMDRIAKVEGKRVSLTAVEQRLQSHAWIDVAKVVVLSGRRTELAVVACLTEQARLCQAEQGKRAVTRALRDFLANHFELPLLPRRWRFIESMPSDAQGKVSQQALLGLFAGKTNTVSDQSSMQPDWLPDVLGYTRLGDDRVEFCLRPQPGLIYFSGHFPGEPVLPGVVQIHWAEHYARQTFGNRLPLPERFARLDAVKFQQLIKPEQMVTLALSLDREKNRLSFQFYHENQRFSAGRIVYTGEEIVDSVGDVGDQSRKSDRDQVPDQRSRGYV